MANGKQHSVWFVTTRMNGLPHAKRTPAIFGCNFQKVTLSFTFHPEFPEIFVQMVSTLCVRTAEEVITEAQ